MTSIKPNIASVTDINRLDKSDINSYWPFADSAPRESQVVVQEFIKSLKPHIRYILCEVPVGGGKSPLALNISGWFSKGLGDAYLLTPQKILQKQYEDSFSDHLMHSLYGKANYSCISKGTNCDIGDSLKPRCSNCPYKSDLAKVAEEPNTVLNYTLGLNLFKYLFGREGSSIGRKKLMVFDEAHQLEGFLTEFNAITISEMRCKKIGLKFENRKLTVPETVDWILKTYQPKLMAYISNLRQIVDDIEEQAKFDTKSKLTLDEIEKIKTLHEMVKHNEEIEENLLNQSMESINNRYVLVSDKTMIKFKELYGRQVFKNFVEPVADRFLFLSSTILDKDAFCSDLGINPEEAAFISLPSEFPEENRTVAYLPTAKMTYGWDTPERTADRKRMLTKIREICNNLHNDDNGVIHAGSFQITKWLVENLEGKIPHQIYHHLPDGNMTRDECINNFQEDDYGVPKLLISPSVTEGLDLKDDKGRFALFTKIPYPFLGDAWVKRRQSLSTRWYTLEALKAIIQGGGRVVRTPEDWGYVYILDSSWEGLLQRGGQFLPDWWLEAYVEDEE